MAGGVLANIWEDNIKMEIEERVCATVVWTESNLIKMGYYKWFL
jgi:hypothetical protein